MKNLETLYENSEDFRIAAREHASDFLGTNSMTFAREWLEHDCASGFFAAGKIVRGSEKTLDADNVALAAERDYWRGEYMKLRESWLAVGKFFGELENHGGGPQR